MSWGVSSSQVGVSPRRFGSSSWSFPNRARGDTVGRYPRAMTEAELVSRVVGLETFSASLREDITALSGTVLEMRDTLDQHSATLDQHTATLGRHTEMLEEILRRLPPAA